MKTKLFSHNLIDGVCETAEDTTESIMKPLEDWELLKQFVCIKNKQYSILPYRKMKGGFPRLP